MHFPPFIHGVTTGPIEKLTVIVSQGAVEDEENFHLMLAPSSSFRREPECARTCILLHFTAGYLMVLYPMKANLRDQLECSCTMDLKGLRFKAVKCLPVHKDYSHWSHITRPLPGKQHLVGEGETDCPRLGTATHIPSTGSIWVLFSSILCS